MKRPLLKSILRRKLRQTPIRHLSIVASTSARTLSDTNAFREKAFIPEKPLHYKTDGVQTLSEYLPAAATWFTPATSSGLASTLSPKLAEFLDWSFPYELLSNPTGDTIPVNVFRDWLSQSSDFTDQILAGILQAAISESRGHTFFQLQAPLKLLYKAVEFNAEQRQKNQHPILLYIAQSSLSDLPTQLQEDLPTPELVKKAGKGDIYNSSIWLGTEPTYTPLHRDPNPNLFCQMCSQKTVRLLPPAIGDRVFFEVQVQLRQQLSSRIRTTDMMEGAERPALHEAVWENKKIEDEIHKADLNPGDALFIPKGWWHSVKSVGSHGQLNGSVNWWFR